mmetsp:Transcript_96682/g.181793  ORF Transcript_96682/g.181793 Transcript_96682/m.181793 type:complete len:348 (+) Transcript_96682:14-1057(+)
MSGQSTCILTFSICLALFLNADGVEDPSAQTCAGTGGGWTSDRIEHTQFLGTRDSQSNPVYDSSGSLQGEILMLVSPVVFCLGTWVASVLIRREVDASRILEKPLLAGDDVKDASKTDVHSDTVDLQAPPLELPPERSSPHRHKNGFPLVGPGPYLCSQSSDGALIQFAHPSTYLEEGESSLHPPKKCSTCTSPLTQSSLAKHNEAYAEDRYFSLTMFNLAKHDESQDEESAQDVCSKPMPRPKFGGSDFMFRPRVDAVKGKNFSEVNFKSKSPIRIRRLPSTAFLLDEYRPKEQKPISTTACTEKRSPNPSPRMRFRNSSHSDIKMDEEEKRRNSLWMMMSERSDL